MIHSKCHGKANIGAFAKDKIFRVMQQLFSVVVIANRYGWTDRAIGT